MEYLEIIVGAIGGGILTEIVRAIVSYMNARGDYEKTTAEAESIAADTRGKLINTDLSAQEVIIKNLTFQYEKVVTRLDAVEDELDQLRDQVYCLREERDDLKDRVEMLEGEREQNREEIAALRKRIETLEGELAQKNAYIQRLEQEKRRL